MGVETMAIECASENQKSLTHDRNCLGQRGTFLEDDEEEDADRARAGG
jgi:hypothetical protein